MTIYYDDPQQLKHVNAYIDQLRAQDDRSCVIMIATRIESLLVHAIDQRLLEPQSNGRRGIGSNLANAIDLAFRLGILHGTHADSLHALRRIRNKIAHLDEPMSLADHDADVADFSRSWFEGRAKSGFHALYEREASRASTQVRAQFLVAASTFFVFLQPLATVVERLDRLDWLSSLDPCSGAAP